MDNNVGQLMSSVIAGFTQERVECSVGEGRIEHPVPAVFWAVQYRKASSVRLYYWLALVSNLFSKGIVRRLFSQVPEGCKVLGHSFVLICSLVATCSVQCV